MDIDIICIGKLKEAYWREACAEYLKRLGAYCTPRVTELPEVRQSGSGRAAEEEVRLAEGRRILSRITGSMYVVTLEIKGRRLSSEGLAERISELGLAGRSEIAFVIGGSLGLSAEVSARADCKLSFSDMTFPHQMMRVILLEQIYRSFKISRGESYHK